jgi:hypothetical protein
MVNIDMWITVKNILKIYHFECKLLPYEYLLLVTIFTTNKMSTANYPKGIAVFS